MKDKKSTEARITLPQDQLRRAYIARINRVMDYIQVHLDDELTLEQLARVADFSAFHFHRIFRAMTGEPLFQFIQRLRLEKAASFLRSSPERSITDIALDCGFSGSAPFARAFRSAFSVSASQYRRAKQSKIGQIGGNTGETEGKPRKECRVSFHYTDGNQMHWRLNMNETKPDAKVEIRELPEMEVAYVRHMGPYKNDAALFRSLFTRLMTWAGSKGLLDFPKTRVLAVYHDDPAVTQEAKQRVSCCVTVPPGTPVDGEIGRMTVPGGKYAMARFELAVGEYEEAWTAVFHDWLPESGWQCDDRPCFELYHNDCEEHPQKKSILDICVPVKPM